MRNEVREAILAAQPEVSQGRCQSLQGAVAVHV